MRQSNSPLKKVATTRRVSEGVKQISLAVCLLLISGSFASARADDFTEKSMAEPKGSIGYQLKLLKAGDVDKLKACFTERQRDQITKEVIEKAQKGLDKVTLDELVDKIEKKEDGKVKTAKIIMKNGRSLTTLHLVDGKWISDTLWFK